MKPTSLASAPRARLDARRAPEPWRLALRDAVRDPDELCRLLDLPPLTPAARAAALAFPLRVPRGYVARMRRGDPADPLLRQVLPLAEEGAPVAGYGADPLAEAAATRAPGLLTKYEGRALLVATGTCAVHCRYCFRRHYPYEEGARASAGFREALAAVAADPTVREVILSGGDPLSLGDGVLGRLARDVAAIPHVRRLRVHSRWPIVLPERVDDALLGWLRGTRLKPVVVVHANHANELDEEVAGALARLVDAGVPLLNQAVLLRDVNDSVEALAQLCERLVDLRVMPYYLHALDRVAGAAHYAVSDDEGLRLVRALRARLPGYAVPRFVREVPGAPSKAPVSFDGT